VSDDPRPGKYRWTGISIALFVIGLLILVPAGLCTVLVGGFSLIEGVSQGDFATLMSSLGIVLIVGGLPTAVGAVLVWAGLKARRRD
jgi:hypothetical protein